MRVWAAFVLPVFAPVFDALDGICRREEISRAEAIRQAVDLLVRRRAADVSGIAFGLWRGRRVLDGLRYQERLRREWADTKRHRPAPRGRSRRRRLQ